MIVTSAITDPSRSPNPAATVSPIRASTAARCGARRPCTPHPAGVFPWDRYGPEVALQVRWAAGVLHPEVFPAQQLIAQTQDFYRRFFGYALSAGDARRMLAGQPPGAAAQ
ncbi:hypothetical protein AB4851_25525 [Burkholderia sp. 22PA0099]|uniref:hypothetical protein n=1 Tax=Burkholderia sp. 22PA0099 TaxID=3237372 RepID=UPI0039C14466